MSVTIHEVLGDLRALALAKRDTGVKFERLVQGTKMRFGKPFVEQKASGERTDRSVIHYDDRATLTGIPEQAYRHELGSRSADEWIVDRYWLKTDQDSGIVHDPNEWSREVGDPRYMIELLARVVTVSVESMNIVDVLPDLSIHHQQ